MLLLRRRLLLLLAWRAGHQAKLFNAHLLTVRAEGSDDKVSDVIAAMHEAGVPPNGRTRKAMALEPCDHELTRQRCMLLKRYQQLGHDGVAVAWQLLDRLVDKGLATTLEFNTLLPSCYTSEAKEALVQRMQEHGVAPDATTTAALLHHYMIEGDADRLRDFASLEETQALLQMSSAEQWQKRARLTKARTRGV